MSIGKLSIIFIGCILLLVGAFYAVDYLSYKSIQFNLSSNVAAATIYQPPEGGSDKEDVKITTLEASSKVRLKPGNYYAVPEGENISTEHIPFEVTDSVKKIDIDPFYSASYLAEHFSNEIPAIHHVISEAYGHLDREVTIQNGTFYHFGEWYSATLFLEETEAREGVDMYAVIMKRSGSTWEIAARPQLLFAYETYPNIPRDILNATNRTLNVF